MAAVDAVNISKDFPMTGGRTSMILELGPGEMTQNIEPLNCCSQSTPAMKIKLKENSVYIWENQITEN